LGRELLIQTGQDVPAIVQSESVPQPPDQAIAFRDARDANDVDSTTAELSAEGIAEPPEDQPQTALQKSEVQKMAEESRQDATPQETNGDRREDAMGAEREREVAARLIGVDAAEQTCYTASPTDPQRRLRAADKAFADSDGQDVLLGAPTWLRLSADGTVLVTVSGMQLSGTWVAPSNDSVHVLVADGGAGVELRLEKTETGFAGAVMRSGHAGVEGDTDAPPTSLRLATTACEPAP